MAQITISFEALFSIFILFVVVALAARRLRFPYTVALVFAGLLTPLFPMYTMPEMSPEIFMTLLLLPLIFEAAIDMDINSLTYATENSPSYL